MLDPETFSGPHTHTGGKAIQEGKRRRCGWRYSNQARPPEWLNTGKYVVVTVKRTLRYFSGEEVRVGDVVRWKFEEGLQCVDKVFEPRTREAEDFLCDETGGILIEPIAVMIGPGGDWEDLKFVSRGPPAPVE